MSFGATRRTRSPSSLRHLHICVETAQAPFEHLQPLVFPCCRMHACSLKPLFFSLVRRMIATLINCVAENTNAHSSQVMSVAFSPDGTNIVSGSCDKTIKVWDVGAPRSPLIAPP